MSRAIDWEGIERDYRTGMFSAQELATKYGNVSKAGITKRAREKGWTKDLGAAVRLATRAKVVAAQITEKVAKEVAEKVAGNVAESSRETQIAVLAAAEVSSGVILRHQGDLKATRDLAMDMLNELKLATHSPDELESLFRQACEGLDEDALDAAKQSMRDLLKLHSRVGSLHKLADTMNKLQPLERKAFALDEEDDGRGSSNGRALSDAERAVRIAAIINRARDAAPPPEPEPAPEGDAP